MNPKLKIAILSYYSGWVNRGVETFVTEIVDRVNNNFQISVYSRPRQSSLSIKTFTQKTLALLAKNPPDILMPLNNGWMSWLSQLFCLRHQTKLILAGFAGIGRIDAFNLWLFPDRFICCTQPQAEWAKSINPWAKLSVIPIGVNTARFQPKGKKYPLPLPGPIVLCVAGPEPYKQVNLAIQAVHQLKTPTSLLVVGRQPPMINQLGNNLLGKRYLNLSVPYFQLDQVYRSVNCFTLPSARTEAYGITILEALASGLPVIINDDPIRHELAGVAGIYVNPNNLDSFSQAISQALQSRQSNFYRQQALKFSWDKITRQYQDLWQNIV